MYIPRLGDKLTLTTDWTFLLHNERRNSKLFSMLKGVEDKLDYRDRIILSDVWGETVLPGMEDYRIDAYPDIDTGKYKEIEVPISTIIGPDNRYGQPVDWKYVKKELKSTREITVHGFTRGKEIRKVYDVTYLRRMPFEDFKYTWPAGTILLVKRVYVRRGNPEYDSVTFSAQTGKYKGKTFWANMDDVNYLEFE